MPQLEVSCCCGRGRGNGSRDYQVSNFKLLDRPEEFGTDMLSFELGQQKQKFIVHKRYICKYSPALNAMFNGVWLESAAGGIKWPEFSPKMFNIFVTWIYNQSLRGVLTNDLLDDSLCELWTFADIYLMPRLKNDVIGLLIHLRNVHGIVVSSQYEKTHEGSQFRKSLCDLLRVSVCRLESNIQRLIELGNRRHIYDAFMEMADSVPLTEVESIVCPLTYDFEFYSDLWESWTTYYFRNRFGAYYASEELDYSMNCIWMHPLPRHIWANKEQLSMPCIKTEFKRAFAFLEQGLIPLSRFIDLCQGIANSHEERLRWQQLEERLFVPELLGNIPKTLPEMRAQPRPRYDPSDEKDIRDGWAAHSRFIDAKEKISWKSDRVVRGRRLGGSQRYSRFF